MSNLSDIGFPVSSDEDVNQILMDVLPHLEQSSCPPYGFYYRFSDGSGAELYLQANPEQDLIGFNPAFAGNSRIKVEVLKAIERDTSSMDGAFVISHPESEAVVVMDLPDFRSHSGMQLPASAHVALTAFASNDFRLVSVTDGDSVDSGATVFAPLRGDGDSILASGPDEVPPQAHIRLNAFVTGAREAVNSLSGEKFFCLSVETGAGAVDVVVDPKLAEKSPREGDFIEGSFWLSGKVVEWDG